MRTSVTQLKPEEINQLLEICQAAGCFDIGNIVRVDEDEDDDDDGHGDRVSHHPKYGMYLYAADPGALRPEHLAFKVASESMDREVDYHHYEIRVGEIIDMMGGNCANLEVVRWFIGYGFKVWEGPRLCILDEIPRIDCREHYRVQDILKRIRAAGRNEDPTAQWMQQWAAHAINPDLPRPPDDPPVQPSPRRALHEMDPTSAASRIRQFMVEVMSDLEQTGIDAALSNALEAFDRRLEQEGIATLPPHQLPATADDELYDEIDPQWWRGNDAGVHGTIERLNEALDGKYDEEDPCFGHPPLTAAILRVRDLRRWVNDLQSKLYINCVYCGHRYGPGESGEVPAKALHDHIATCPEHPLSKALKTINRIEVIAGEAMSNGGHEVIAIEEIFEEAREGQQS